MMKNILINIPKKPLLDYLPEIKDLISKYSKSADKERRIPSEIINIFHDKGLFNIWVSKSIGGVDIDPLQTIMFLEELAMVDASSAWALMIGIEINSVITSHASDEVIQEFFDGSSPAIGGGVVMPGGSISQVEDGSYSVTGLWSFGTGCLHSSWVLGSCIMMENGMPRMGEGGHPQLYAAMLPTSKINIDDTWHTLGMRGTGSNHWGVKNHTIESKYIWPIDEKPSRSSIANNFPGAVLFSITKACIALGVARSAVELYLAWAKNTLPPGSNYYVSEDTNTQIEYAKNISDIESARVFLYDSVKKIQDATTNTTYPDDKLIALAHLACVKAASTAFEVTTSIGFLAGASAIVFNDKPLQQKIRDIITIRSHIALNHRMIEASGACLMDADPVSVVPFWDMNKRK